MSMAQCFCFFYVCIQPFSCVLQLCPSKFIFGYATATANTFFCFITFCFSTFFEDFFISSYCFSCLCHSFFQYLQTKNICMYLAFSMCFIVLSLSKSFSVTPLLQLTCFLAVITFCCSKFFGINSYCYSCLSHCFFITYKQKKNT